MRAGFDAIASNLPVILFPLIFDLLLWLGPRLRTDRLFKPFFDQMSVYAVQSGLPNNDLLTLQGALEEFSQQLGNFNLLSIVRTFPIGVFSLMSGRPSLATPLGSPPVFHVSSITTLLFWIGMLTLTGWLAGSLFFRGVASVVTGPSAGHGRFGSYTMQTILLSVVWIALITAIGLPFMILLTLAVAANPFVANGILLFTGLLSMWLVVPIFFMPHGIYLKDQNAFASIFASFRMARFTLPTSSLFVISVLVIAYGLNFLWNIPSSNSWMAFVGIAGHAFITTSLLAASFIYYRDMHTWLQTVLEKFKANLPAGQT